MAVRKDKNSWWIDFRFNRARYRKRSPVNSRAGAQTYEATLRQRLARGESIDDPTPKPEMTFGQFAPNWFETYVKANNKYSEQYGKQKILAASLVPFFGNMALSEIATRQVELFKAQQMVTGDSKPELHKLRRSKISAKNKDYWRKHSTSRVTNEVSLVLIEKLKLARSITFLATRGQPRN